MTQVHKRFTVEQVKVLFQGYLQGNLSREDVEGLLEISKTRFFALLKDYRQDPEGFSIAYHRATQTRLSDQVEAEIQKELLREKALIEDPDLPIRDYNYSALADRLKKKGIQVSTTTITKRAKALNCYRPRKKKAVHDREVLTQSIGDLIQHDASLHKWSPYAEEKWTLITSLDDYSRMLLYADLVKEENTWVHIQAAQSLMQTFGLPMRYYVDNLRVFRFVQHRDSVWRTHHLATDEVIPNGNRSYASSTWVSSMHYLRRPRARWSGLTVGCKIGLCVPVPWKRSLPSKIPAPSSKEEVHRYNYHQVHSTTAEVPAIRFANARNAGNSLFRPFALPKPYKSVKDIFCLRVTRTLDGYRRISLDRHVIEVPKVDVREDVELHLVPDFPRYILEVRIWFNDRMVHSVNLPLKEFRRFE